MIAKIENMKISGIACALPKNKINVKELNNNKYSEHELNKITNLIGANNIFYADHNQTSSDLCYEAAVKLISDIGWNEQDIDGLIFVSQTTDHILPATSFILHEKLRLAKSCVVFDLNFGCSGYINGVYLASQLISARSCQKVLLLVGDTISKTISKDDSSVAMVFGDGASATAIEYSNIISKTTIIIHSDGTGYDSIIIPAGGFRKPKSESSCRVVADKDGNLRSEENIYMNGMEIFLFSIREIPLLLKQILTEHGWNDLDVNKYLLHQANLFMLQTIAKKAKLSFEKFPINIDSFGNTSGASIPLLVCDKLKQEIMHSSLNVVMVGFGVGLSWGAIAMQLENVYCSKIIYV